MTEKYNWELDYEVGDCKLMECDGRWKRVTSINEENGNRAWIHVSIVDVPLDSLIREYESLLIELSDKEVKLLIKKEYIKEQSFKIEQETDFKEIYGKNNADIRKQHIKGELADVYDEV